MDERIELRAVFLGRIVIWLVVVACFSLTGSGQTLDILADNTSMVTPGPTLDGSIGPQLDLFSANNPEMSRACCCVECQHLAGKPASRCGARKPCRRLLLSKGRCIGDGWVFSIAPIGYLPWIDLETTLGNEVNIGPDDLLKNVDMGLITVFEARKGKLAIATEVVYARLTLANTQPFVRIDAEEWIVSPRLIYRSWEGDCGYFDWRAGIRVTDIDLSIVALDPAFSENIKGTNYDAVLGFGGRYQLSDRTYLRGYLDLGGGESAFILDGLVDLNYQWRPNADLNFGFRHVYWDFSGDLLKEESVYGLQYGLTIWF